MPVYNFALFVHLVGVVVVFVGVGVWLFAVSALRRAEQVAQVRAPAGLRPQNSEGRRVLHAPDPTSCQGQSRN